MGLRLLSGLLDGHAGVLDSRPKGTMRVPKAGTQGLNQHLLGHLRPVHPSVLPQGLRVLPGARWDTAVSPIGWGLALASSPTLTRPRARPRVQSMMLSSPDAEAPSGRRPLLRVMGRQAVGHLAGSEELAVRFLV